MAQCEWCGEETQPGDLKSLEIEGRFHFFCSADHGYMYREQGPAAAPANFPRESEPAEVSSPESAADDTPSPPPARRRAAKRKPKAGPA